MEPLALFDIVLHIDKYLLLVLENYGTFIYAILFFIIFMETGFVVTPFLPGDSLLFAAGALSATGGLNHLVLFFMLSLAAILGDTINYWVGYLAGPRVFTSNRSKILNRAHLEKTRLFYEKYGGKVIIIARFMPIIRTFAPFVAGIGKMNYPRFLSYNVVGGITWIAIFIFGGYYFGNIPTVRQNFSLIILGIIFVSVLPMFLEIISQKAKKK